MAVNDNLAFSCGCTACVTLIVGNKIYCANAGDSRCVVSQKKAAVPLSFDHKPSNMAEEDRIKKAGGHVSFDRVNGNLNLSRAFGDFVYKEGKELSVENQMVIPIPEINTHTIDNETDFMIIACDGIWDCFTNENAVSYIHEQKEVLSTSKDSEFKISDLNEAIFERNCATDTAGNVSETGKEGAG